jgi:Iap family predicted aminopeptidase
LQKVRAPWIGYDDSHAFLNARIPLLTMHSLTQETWSVLHSPADNLKAIHPDDYYAFYRLAAALLSLIDSTLE